MSKIEEVFKDILNIIWGEEKEEKPKKRKRARKADGTFRGDDKSTPNVNEAWESE